MCFTDFTLNGVQFRKGGNNNKIIRIAQRWKKIINLDTYN